MSSHYFVILTEVEDLLFLKDSN